MRTATASTTTRVERAWASRGIRGGAYGVGYPRPPVAKKHRVRARSRRAVEASRRASAARPAALEREQPSRPAATSRTTRYGSHTGTSRAVGAPSQGLERAAAWERGYVTKDFRRMAIVVVIALALLVVAGLVLNVFEH